MEVGRLPDAHAYVCRALHCIGLRAGKRKRESGHIADWPVNPVFRWRVLVGLHLQAQLCRALRGAPTLRVGQEKALIRRQTINVFVPLALCGELERIVGNQ